MTDQASLFERVGGTQFFEALVAAFYRGVAEDPILRPMYPDDELGPAADRLRMFLEQYWGGPRTYSETRGHPRLRARHLPFRIDERARDAWLTHMLAAVEEQQIGDAERAELRTYLISAADFLVNTD